jgi:hypothetical protein
MASLTIRNLDDNLKARLRVQAAQHGRSMEEEVRNILRQALSEPPVSEGLGQCLLKRFQSVASDDWTLPERSLPRQPPTWDSPK